jgi:hypothetical protein
MQQETGQKKNAKKRPSLRMAISSRGKNSHPTMKKEALFITKTKTINLPQVQ